MHRGVNKALLTLPQREGALTSTSLVGFESQELKRKLFGKMAHEVPTLKFFGSRSHPHSTALRYSPCVFWFRSTRQLHLPHLHGSSLCLQTSLPAVFPPRKVHCAPGCCPTPTPTLTLPAGPPKGPGDAVTCGHGLSPSRTGPGSAWQLTVPPGSAATAGSGCANGGRPLPASNYRRRWQARLAARRGRAPSLGAGRVRTGALRSRSGTGLGTMMAAAGRGLSTVRQAAPSAKSGSTGAQPPGQTGAARRGDGR